MIAQYSYIETFGCQMNERDSEIMTQLLGDAGYSPTGEMQTADLVVINTCSIRDKAEQKVYSLLGRLRGLKQKKPALIVAVAGCVAQQEGEKLSSRMEQVDIVVGTQHIYQLPELVAKVKNKKGPQVAVALLPQFEIPAYLPPSTTTLFPASRQPSNPQDAYRKFVTIMQGCNNFCTYCVVPYTRGREVSRPVVDILAEITRLTENGIREVTLLGQNVNSYGQDKPGTCSFPELLHRVAEVDGLERLRFTTSNPKDLSEELMRCFTEIDKLCPHFHLPVQSGSDSVLRAMNRKYTIEEYLSKVASLRRYRPDIALTTDIIVGFPGESTDDFEKTMDLLETVRYHSAFSFKYSDRPMTRSTDFGNKVSEEEKSLRLARLQARQKEITVERNQEYVTQVIEVMVEGKSRTAGGQWSGRTPSNHIVNFDAPCPVPGEILKVKIEEACMHSLRGCLL